MPKTEHPPIEEINEHELSQATALGQKLHAYVDAAYQQLDDPTEMDLFKMVLERVKAECPDLIPLVMATSQVFPDRLQANSLPSVGHPLINDGVTMVDFRHSTISLVDPMHHRLQTMVRLMVSKDQKFFLIDVWSDVIQGAYDYEKHGYNYAATMPSRMARIIKLSVQGYEIHGWVELDNNSVPPSDSAR